MKTIKIAINVSPLSDGNSVRGVGYYTKNLIEFLQKEISNNASYKNWQISLINNKNSDLKSYDLIHYPFFDPFKLTLPAKKKIPFVVTVHDLIPIQFSQNYPKGIKGYINWLLQRKKLKQAKIIITDSYYSKQIISKITRYPDKNIIVTYLAASDNFKPEKNKDYLETIRSKYSLPDKFVLYVGDINWNKNIPSLVTSCYELKIPLVIVGSSAVSANIPKHPETHDLIWLQNQNKNKSFKKYLFLIGYVPDEDLNAFYNLATFYCQPSFAEGFGLPVVQAMRAGCPVAYSHQTSLVEIMQDNGLSFDPYSRSNIKSAINKLWTDPHLRQQLILNGLNHAKDFDWKITAKKTLEAYNLALSHDQR